VSPGKEGVLAALAILAVTLAFRALLPWLAPGTWSPALYAPALLAMTLMAGLPGLALTVLVLGVDAAASRALENGDAGLVEAAALVALAAMALLLRHAMKDTLLSYAAARDAVQAEAREQLDAAQHRQSLLQHELTHRVKNNFQLVGSLLRLQSRRAGNEEATRILNTTVLRIQGMAALHESLYRNRDIGRVELGHYLREVCGRIAEAQVDGRDIAITVNAEAAELPGEYALPLGLAVSELVSNALHHGFPEGRGGEITVSFRRDGDDFVLGVSDNGRGVEDPDTVLNRGFGMLLVGSCAHQVEGALEFHADPPRFEIRFPAALSA
jgi:two-component sensor histidine kinase